MTNSIRENLLQNISTGETVLFLGAGAIYGSSIGKDRSSALLGNALRDKLQEKFFSEEGSTNLSLKRICSNIQSLKGNSVLQQALTDFLMPVNPSNALITIPRIVWRAIYTVNIDDSIEQAYSVTDERVQKLVPVVSPGDKAARNHDLEVSYYKLHGCLRSPDEGLIFSHRDYTESREKKLKLFASLTSELCDFPFLFVGFSLEDDDFQIVWESVIKYLGSGQRSAPTYLVTPQPPKSFVDSLELEGINVIDDSVLTFFPWLQANVKKHALPINDRIHSRIAPIQELIRRDFDQNVDTELVDQINLNFEFIRQIKNSLSNGVTSRFLFGSQPKWDDIKAGSAIARELEQDIIEDIDSWFAKPSFRTGLIKAGAGYGKSTLLMQIAMKVARWSQKMEILYLKSSGDFDAISIAEYSKALNLPVIVIVDDIFRHLISLDRLKNDATDNRLPIYILGATRPADWYAARRNLGAFDTQSIFDLPRLTQKESRDLASAMKRSGKLSTAMQKLSVDELANHYYEACEKHLLAGLLTSVSESNSEFEKILVDEYFRIDDEIARKLYLAVCLAHSLGLPTPASLACNVVKINIACYHSNLAPVLDTTIVEFSHQISGDLMFMTQHRVISEALVQEIMRPAEAVDQLLSFAGCINPHHKEQYDILLRIYDEVYLDKLLKHPGTIRSCYERLVESFPADTFIKQHFAIFESHQKNFKKAHELIDEAISIRGRHSHLLNTQANILLRESINEKDRGRSEHLLSSGTKLLRERIEKDTDKEIHILSLVGRLLDWAKRKDLTEVQRLNALEEAESVLDSARAKYPASSDIATSAARLQIQLGQLPDAKNLLLRGIKLNGGNTYARTLLARILLKDGDEQGAYNLVEEGLKYSPRSCGLLHIRIEAARNLNLPWTKLRSIVTEYLTVAENDITERIYLIKGLIEASDLASAKKQLERLKRVEAPFSEKIGKIMDITKNCQPLMVEGEYIQRAIGKGYVKLFGYPEGMNAFLDMRKLSNPSIKLYQGKHIHIHLAINGFGLIARKIIH